MTNMRPSALAALTQPGIFLIIYRWRSAGMNGTWTTPPVTVWLRPRPKCSFAAARFVTSAITSIGFKGTAPVGDLSR